MVKGLTLNKKTKNDYFSASIKKDTITMVWQSHSHAKI